MFMEKKVRELQMQTMKIEAFDVIIYHFAMASHLSPIFLIDPHYHFLRFSFLYLMINLRLRGRHAYIEGKCI